jgi:hypothetical protein
MASTSGPQPPALSRRRFLERSLGAATAARIGLLGGIGGTVVATTACGSEPLPAPTVVGLYSPSRVLAAGRPQRVPIALVADDGAGGEVALPADDAEIEVVVLDGGTEIDRIVLAGHVVEHDHVGDVDPDHQHADLFRYYPLRFEVPRPGIYDLSIETGLADVAASTLAVQFFDPAEVEIPLPGDRIAVPDTPTFDRPDGIDRLCTRFEPCPFHTRSAAQVVDEGVPLALLVATPAFCSTAYCGPVLDTLLESVAGRDDLEVVHLEVYANTDDVGGNLLDPNIRLAAPVVDLGLTFEPSLFLIGADGILVDRIDNVFDRSEADAAIDRLVSA